MKQTIFYLEERGGMYLYHFFVLNLGGLYYIINQNYNVRGPTTSITYPIKIYMKDVLPFQREAFEIIKDKFESVDDDELQKITDYEIVSIYGETCINGYSDNCNIFPFLRQLFLERMNYNVIKGKRIFITRKNSESQHYGVLKRMILNENELLKVLDKYGFQYIQLENLNTYDKIKLFMESEMIVSSHSGSLTFSLFVNQKTKIIEILNKGTSGFLHDHYLNISNKLNLNFNRYNNIIEDSNGNFSLNLIDFEKYLQSLI